MPALTFSPPVYPQEAFLALSLLLVHNALVHADVTVTEKDDRIRVEIDGKLFTESRFRGAPHVYFFPLIGPGDAKMTRSWSMEEAPDQEHDHPHHRSLWFAHGLVNGVDLWAEPASFKKKPRDGEMWGKRAAWVDYSGPIDGQTLGIAFFDDPGNPGHPNRWHARDYGLFAANPFCAHGMDPSPPDPARDGSPRASRCNTATVWSCMPETA